MSSKPKIDVTRFVKQEGNTCGAHSIYNYLVLTNPTTFTADPDEQRAAIAAIYNKIILPETKEAALPHMMLAFLNTNHPAVTLYGSNTFKEVLEAISSQLKIEETINYDDDPFSVFLKPGDYGIALWQTTEKPLTLDQLVNMHYTVVYKNADEKIYKLDSNCPDKSWQLVDPKVYLKFMVLLFV